MCVPQWKKSTEGSCTCAALWLSLDSALHITAWAWTSDLTEVTSMPPTLLQPSRVPEQQNRVDIDTHTHTETETNTHGSRKGMCGSARLIPLVKRECVYIYEH